jgi:flagellin
MRHHGGLLVSFSINTNLMAMDAMDNLDTVSGQLSQSMERLSTGLQINSAADNPSGLIISQQMDAQIGGMNQAIQNSQEAINYVKTADGALSQVNSLLNNAYSLAVQSANSATLSSSQLQANQQQLNSIVSSITQIAQQTTYGTKYLLNGSSGVQSSVTAGADVASLNIGGTFGGQALTTNATVTLNSIVAATQAQETSAGFATINTTVANTGSFTLNGVTFTANANTTAGDLINMINQSSNQTGVVASYTGSAIQLNSIAYGTQGTINLVDANGVFLSAPGTLPANGTNAMATVDVGGTTALFTGGINGNGGLTLEDADGNTMTMTVAGNTTDASAQTIGQVIVGSATFQVGGQAGQTASVSLGNFAASNLGQGAVSGLNLSNLDLTTQTGAANAMLVIQQAITNVTTARGAIGNFQANVLQVNVNTLTTAQQNLSSSLSTIQDTNIASEMTNFTKLQILEQSGMSVLSQANQLPQQILSLIKNS